MADSKFEIVDGVLKKYTGTDKEVIIPEGVVEIGDRCFVDAHFMESLTIPSTLKKIGYTVFATSYAGYEYSLKKVFVDSLDTWLNISFSDDVSSLLGVSDDIELFIGNKLVTDLVIPGTYKVIKRNCFYGYKKLKSVVFEEGVEIIEKGAFVRSGIEKVILPNSLKDLIGEQRGLFASSPFKYCENLKEINIPNSIKVLPDNFLANSLVEKIQIPESVEVIPSGCFSGCNNLREVHIPNSVHTVLDAFKRCNSLKELIYPDNVHVLGSMSFDNIEKIVLPEDWNYSGNKHWSLFEHSKLDKLEMNEFDNALYIGSRTNPYQVLIRAKNKDIESCIIHERCQYICGCQSYSYGNMGFYECKNIKALVIPNGVKRIEPGAFAKCESLESIDLPSNFGVLDPNIYEGSTKLKIKEFGVKDKIITFEKSIVLDDITVKEEFTISSNGINLVSTRTSENNNPITVKFQKKNPISSERLISIFSQVLKAEALKEEDYLNCYDVYKINLSQNNKDKEIKYVFLDEEMVKTIYSLFKVFIGEYFLINTHYKDVLPGYHFNKDDVRKAIEQEYQGYNLEQLGELLKNAADSGDFLSYEKINLLMYKLKNNGEWNNSYEE